MHTFPLQSGVAVDDIEMEIMDDFKDEDYLTSSEDELSDDND